ncbi:MAG: sensor histidine kinase, partial [Candidatus Paceibacterota bacterium]
AVLRRTLWYLLFTMLLSVGFSMALYQVSTQEFERDRIKLEALLEKSFFRGRPVPELESFNLVRFQQLEESRHTVRLNLIYFNVLILGLGGVASYLLARRTLQPIEENMESQSRFATDASHELRTPLTAIRSELEVALRDKNLTLTESKLLHKSTLEEVARLEALSSGLLKLSQQDIQKDLALAPVSAARVVQETVRQMTKQADAKKITLVHTAEEGAFEADQWSMVELLSIFVDNAIKYSPKGSTVTLKASFRHHKRQVALSVHDEGEGIAEQDIPYIFDRFYRADSSRTKNETSGYGLGLSIAKKIIDMHRGRVTITSKPGNGTTFTVFFPVHQGTSLL